MQERTLRFRFLRLWPVLLLTTLPSLASAQTPAFDLVIRNGRVLDGTGNPWIQQDIGIRGGEIVAIGDLDDAAADRTVDATGLYVSPRFIDLHSHADRALSSEHIEARRAGSLVSQGLTTVVGGPDGRTPVWPLSEEVAAYEELGIAMNVVPMVGHNTVRGEVMGDDDARAATADEIQRMKELVRQGMEAGALGGSAPASSTGLVGSARPKRSLSSPAWSRITMGFTSRTSGARRSFRSGSCRAMPRAGRSRGYRALEETINIARETGIRVVATHHKARGRSSFGRSAHDTVVINQARARATGLPGGLSLRDVWRRAAHHDSGVGVRGSRGGGNRRPGCAGLR